MPGVRMRFWPAASAALIWASELEGVAMKKVLMAREVPASPLPMPPPVQLGARRIGPQGRREDPVVAAAVHI